MGLTRASPSFLVMDEVAPRMRGLSGDELTTEVKEAVDRILTGLRPNHGR